MICVDANKRLTAREAMEHAWFTVRVTHLLDIYISVFLHPRLSFILLAILTTVGTGSGWRHAFGRCYEHARPVQSAPQTEGTLLYLSRMNLSLCACVCLSFSARFVCLASRPSLFHPSALTLCCQGAVRMVMAINRMHTLSNLSLRSSTSPGPNQPASPSMPQPPSSCPPGFSPSLSPEPSPVCYSPIAGSSGLLDSSAAGAAASGRLSVSPLPQGMLRRRSASPSSSPAVSPAPYADTPSPVPHGQQQQQPQQQQQQPGRSLIARPPSFRTSLTFRQSAAGLSPRLVHVDSPLAAPGHIASLLTPMRQPRGSGGSGGALGLDSAESVESYSPSASPSPSALSSVSPRSTPRSRSPLPEGGAAAAATGAAAFVTDTDTAVTAATTTVRSAEDVQAGTVAAAAAGAAPSVRGYRPPRLSVTSENDVIAAASGYTEADVAADTNMLLLADCGDELSSAGVSEPSSPRVFAFSASSAASAGSAVDIVAGVFGGGALMSPAQSPRVAEPSHAPLTLNSSLTTGALAGALRDAFAAVGVRQDNSHAGDDGGGVSVVTGQRGSDALSASEPGAVVRSADGGAVAVSESAGAALADPQHSE